MLRYSIKMVSPHMHQEGIKKGFTCIMKLSKGIRAGSQEDLKMAWDFMVVSE